MKTVEPTIENLKLELQQARDSADGYFNRCGYLESELIKARQRIENIQRALDSERDCVLRQQRELNRARIFQCQFCGKANTVN